MRLEVTIAGHRPTLVCSWRLRPCGDTCPQSAAAVKAAGGRRA